MQYNYLHAMKKFYKNSKKYVLLSLISMSLVLQSCEIEGNQDIIPTVKQLPGVRPKISQDDTENPGNHRHRSRPIEGMNFTGKRKREKAKQETSLVPTQDKRIKLEGVEDENASSEDDVEEITDTDPPMNLITFLEAIPQSNRARKKAQKPSGEENGREKQVLKKIFRHLSFSSMLNLTLVHSNLYKLINHWNEIGAKGLDIVVPDTSRILNNPYTVNEFYTHFDKIPYTPETIPSAVFYRIIQKASKLPKEYWPYLSKTSITEIALIADDLTDEDFLTVCNYLVDSKIKQIYLDYNKITDKGMDELIQAKKDLKGIQINLKGNNISKEIQERVSEAYPEVTWVF